MIRTLDEIIEKRKELFRVTVDLREKCNELRIATMKMRDRNEVNTDEYKEQMRELSFTYIRLNELSGVKEVLDYLVNFDSELDLNRIGKKTVDKRLNPMV